ncbi:MAG TPA: SH3 domain-containing protein, partial [Dehalococcoidia bacterium]|nr:SH3 domain-containing protein [Dehalococcoidia bacterium]
MTEVCPSSFRNTLRRMAALFRRGAAEEDESINGMLEPRRTAQPLHRHTTASTATSAAGAASPWAGRRTAGLLALAALLVFSAVRTGHAAADTVTSPTGAVNSSDGLNLRSGPGQSYDVLAVMPNGATVTITGNPTPDNWLPLQYNGQVGWADGAYITLNASSATANTATPPTPPALPQATGSPASSATPAVVSATPAPAATANTATVVPPDGLNLRSGPDTSYGVVTVLPGGATLTITGAANNQWYPVSVNGQNGWVDGAYISLGANATGSGNAVITANAVSSTGGAAVSASAGTSSSNSAATPTASPSPSASPTPSASPAASTGQRTLAWPTNSRRISTVFSPSHLGVDIDEFPAGGNPVGASAPGTVTYAGGDPCCSYGLHVILDNGNGME